MGRKIEMKKIVDVTKCQVTFSKRRSSLMKKANELAVCCDADVAFIAFSPSGRISKFSNLKKIEDLLYRYVNLPADKRLSHISNVQEKLEKINNLSHINGDSSKLHYLDKQIENLELQIKKTNLESQILETDIRDYEIAPDQEPSLHQLSWCERNLTQSLQRVIARKMEFTSANKGKQVPVAENPSSSQVFMQNDPWSTGLSSAGAHESMFNDFQGSENMFSTDLNRAPFQQSSSLHTTSEHCTTDPPVFQYQEQNNAQAMKQSLPMDQPLPFFDFNEPNNADAYNLDGDGDGDADADADVDAYVLFSDSVNMSTVDSCSVQLDPRPSTGVSTTNPSTSEVPRTVFDEMGMLTSDLMGQFRHMDEGEQAENTTFTYGNNAGDENSVAPGTTSMDQQGPPYVPQQEEPSQVPEFDNNLLEETREDQSQWDMNQQRNNVFWEWDEFLLDENFNFHNFPPL
ncbi:agamous-like MADS-box protein AGL66 [Salvia hispanica]|uniref:agamous-like MADS-box protein AGL66 n=1 Tax=Salvia hispanica TaxID=49212 RepID=UPI002009B998|nr:agamous-like MADS-box protein AGL66 [Salvia hispanica]